MSNRGRAKTNRSKPRRNRRASPRNAVPETTSAIIEYFFLTIKVPVRINGLERKITAFEAIIFQLLQKESTGDIHASRVLQKYEELAPPGAEAALQIAFVENDYTQAMAAPPPATDHG